MTELDIRVYKVYEESTMADYTEVVQCWDIYVNSKLVGRSYKMNPSLDVLKSIWGKFSDASELNELEELVCT